MVKVERERNSLLVEKSGRRRKEALKVKKEHDRAMTRKDELPQRVMIILSSSMSWKRKEGYHGSGEMDSLG